MLCIAFERPNDFKIGFPGPMDTVLFNAVAARLRRLMLKTTKPKKTKRTKKPFLHTYKCKGDTIVLCAHVEELEHKQAKTALKALLGAIEKGGVTNVTLNTMTKLYTVKIGACPKENIQGLELTDTSAVVSRSTIAGIVTTRERLEKTMKEAEEVKSIIFENMKKSLQKGENLEDLEKQSEELRENSWIYHGDVKKVEVKKKAEYRKWKWACIIVGCIVCIVLLGGTVFGIVKYLVPFIRSK